MEKDIYKNLDKINRRNFLTKTAMGFGGLALSSIINPFSSYASNDDDLPLGVPHFAPKAKRVIYLFQSGGPSQLETFDYKPLLEKMNGEQLPDSVRKGQRLTGMPGSKRSPKDHCPDVGLGEVGRTPLSP